MTERRPPAERLARATGRGIIWHTASSSKTLSVVWLVAAMRENAGRTADWQRALLSRASLLHETEQLYLQWQSGENLTALEIGVHALLEPTPEPQPEPLPATEPEPDLPTILTLRNRIAGRGCCAADPTADGVPLPTDAVFDAETVSDTLFELTLAALVLSGRLVLAVRVGPLPPGYVPPTWACACGPKRLAAPLVPRGPDLVSLSDVQSQGHRSGLSRGGLVLTA
ncbi:MULTISPECIES: hypothetical protein [unclassified Streptomyces]|uniref:hypothetical protein n=1 Tax=unclassified Streptomyces TaxID=2593676 RepID=UPI00362FAAA1